MKGGGGRLRLLCCPGKHSQKKISDLLESPDLEKIGQLNIISDNDTSKSVDLGSHRYMHTAGHKGLT